MMWTLSNESVLFQEYFSVLTVQFLLPLVIIVRNPRMKKSAKKTGIYRAFESGGKKLKDLFVKKTKSNDVHPMEGDRVFSIPLNDL